MIYSFFWEIHPTLRRLVEKSCKGDKRIYKVRFAGATYSLSRTALHLASLSPSATIEGTLYDQCRRHLRRIRRLLT